MAYIGEYIHYHLENYRKYGIGRRGEENPVDLTSAIADSRAQLNTLISSELFTNINAQGIEEFLNAVLNKTGFSTTGLEVSQEQIEQWENQFAKLIEERFPNMEANFSRLSLKQLTASGEAYSTFNVGQDQKRMYVQTIQKVITTLKDISKNLQISLATSSGLNQQQIQKIQEQQAQVTSFIRSLNNIKRKAHGTNIITLNDSNKALFQLINDTIRSIQGPSNKDLGDLAEMYVAFMLEAAAGQTSKTLNELIGPFGAVTGDVRQATILGGANPLTMKYLVKELNSNKTDDDFQATQPNRKLFTLQDDGTAISTTATQGTVDVSITFPTDSALSQLFGLDQFNASIKNYSNISRTPIHVLSGAPLFSLMMLLDTNFINHYINLLVTHPDGSVGGSEINTAEEAIKEAIAIRALTGARSIEGINYNLANVFVVNDRRTGRFRVIGTGTLIQQLSNNMDKLASFSGLPKSLSNIFIGDTYNYEEAAQRIAKILAQLHACKISMSLMPSALA